MEDEWVTNAVMILSVHTMAKWQLFLAVSLLCNVRFYLGIKK